MLKQTVLCSPVGTSSTGTLVIERDVFEEVINYAKAAGHKEVCGFLLVRRQSSTLYSVLPNSLHIPLQWADIGASEPLPQGQAAQMDIEEPYEDDEDVFRLLWHSHMGGSAHFSSVDLKTADDMSRSTGFNAMFFMVVNQHGQATANLEVYYPFRIGTQLRLVVLENEEAADLETYKAELARKCEPFPLPDPAIEKSKTRPVGAPTGK